MIAFAIDIHTLQTLELVSSVSGLGFNSDGGQSIPTTFNPDRCFTLNIEPGCQLRKMACGAEIPCANRHVSRMDWQVCSLTIS